MNQKIYNSNQVPFIKALKCHGLALSVTVSLAVMGCGGGGPLAGVSTGGTGSFTSGPITGFGSVIVNGVRYDDSKAAVGDLDGNPLQASTDLSSGLKLGMLVAVQGGATTAAPVGSTYAAVGDASKIVALTELKGPVQAIDNINSTLKVLGQMVAISTTTVIEDIAGGITLASIGVSDSVEVYGLWDSSTKVWQATRIEVLSSPPTSYRLTGEVMSVSEEVMQIGRTGTLGGWIAVNVSGISVDPNIGVGSEVRLRLKPSQVNGAYPVEEIKLADWTQVPGIDFSDADLDGHEAELEGVIRSLVGSQFVLQGIAVNGQALTGDPLLANGRRVEVKGYFSGATLVATEIESEDDDDREAKGFELHGVLSQVDAQAQTFVLRGYTVRYGANGNRTTFGVVAPAVGMNVEAKIERLADGTWWAREIELEDTSDDDDDDDDGIDDDDDGD